MPHIACWLGLGSRQRAQGWCTSDLLQHSASIMTYNSSLPHVTCMLAVLSSMVPAACRNVGWDKGDVWFAHSCMLDEAETKQFADNHIGIAHCPSSNMRLASGVHDLLRLGTSRCRLDACSCSHVWMPVIVIICKHACSHAGSIWH